MPISSLDNDDEHSEECSEESDEFDRDMDALKRACLLAGSDPLDVGGGGGGRGGGGDSGSASESEENGDLEFVRSVQEKLSLPLMVNPLSIRAQSPSGSDYEDNDFEILRAIQRRFAKYESGTPKEKTETSLHKEELFSGRDTTLKDLPSGLQEIRKNTEELGEEFPQSGGIHALSEDLGSLSNTNTRNQPSGCIEYHCPQYEAFGSSVMPLEFSGIPKFARLFIEALKKNRLCQKLIRSKMMQIEARIEENMELRGRIKCLVDFQVSCKRRAGRILGQNMDARVKLISLPKDRRNSNKVKDKDGITPALFLGPAENSHVSNYKMVFRKFPNNLKRLPWSKEQKESLINGVKQQFQEAVLRKSMEIYSVSNKFSGDANLLDKIIESITDLEITPENTRTFLPQVDWERLVSMYVKGRSDVECEARWLNFEDPMINHNPWTKLEDKKLLYTVQQRGVYNWIDIAIALGSNRSPSQCLSRYQRSLNAHILKKEWTEGEDAQLRALVEAHGESDWQLIASNLEGRTGSQCLDRWRKVLNPCRKRVGRWTVEEDKHLKIAVMLFGPKTWKKIAHFVPGRTQAQCRERWRDALDPSLKLEEWTEEEDSSLKAAIVKHGHCWSKVAACVPPRTDSQCRRRWKVLFPEQVPLAQMARKMHKSALISNFVGREKERPAIGPDDFLPPPEISLPEAKNGENKRKQKKKKSNSPKPKKQKDKVSCNTRKRQKQKDEASCNSPKPKKQKDEVSRNTQKRHKQRDEASCVPKKASSKKPDSTSKKKPDEISKTTDGNESLVVSNAETSIDGIEHNLVNNETVPDQDVCVFPTNNVFQKKQRKSKPQKLSWRMDRRMEAADNHGSISRKSASTSKKRKEKASYHDPHQAASKKSRTIDKNHSGGISITEGDGALVAAGDDSMKRRKSLELVSVSDGGSELGGADSATPHLEPSVLGIADTNGAALDGATISMAPPLFKGSVCSRTVKRELRKSQTEDNNHPRRISVTDGDGVLIASKSLNGVYSKKHKFDNEKLVPDHSVGNFLGDNTRNTIESPRLVSGRERCSELGGDPHIEPSDLGTATPNGGASDGIATTTDASLPRGTISLTKLKHELRKRQDELPHVAACNGYTLVDSGKEVANIYLVAQNGEKVDDLQKDGFQNVLDKESCNAGGAIDVSCSTASLTSCPVVQFPSNQTMNSEEQTDSLISGNDLPEKENPSILPTSPRDSCSIVSQDNNARQRSRRASRRNINYKDMLKGVIHR